MKQYLFYAKERQMTANEIENEIVDLSKNLDDENRRRKKGLMDIVNSGFLLEGYYWTPFTGRYATFEDAMDFLNRNGAFWKARGVELALYKKAELICTDCLAA